MHNETNSNGVLEKDEEYIASFLEPGDKSNVAPGRIQEILAKAREAKGLTIDEVGTLLHVKDTDLLNELFSSARQVKEAIYGRRLVLFAPLYISNLCSNECLYCAFPRSQ